MGLKKTETESKSYYSNFFSSQDNVIIAGSGKEIPSGFNSQCVTDS